MGRRFTEVNPHDNTHALFWLWATIVVYNVALTGVKLSVLLQYLRIFPAAVRDGPLDERHKPSTYRIATLVMIGVVSVFSSWAIISAVLTCIPVHRFWLLDRPGKCLPRRDVW